ncbi:MAG TPA: SDR family NAD(P)-dependent oxidoreductase, partial [Flavobacteriales bacterium]|nr:SDR family NAD(P)-dependent oxidoreductase [Flavobacteriales bacterium]
MAKTKRGKAKASLSELLSLEGRKALVTGAASGIGRAMALRLAEAGAQLVLMDRDEEKLGNLGEEIPTAELHAIDISQKSAIDRFWEGRTGRDIDILVNNAGIYPFKPFL